MLGDGFDQSDDTPWGGGPSQVRQVAHEGREACANGDGWALRPILNEMVRPWRGDVQVVLRPGRALHRAGLVSTRSERLPRVGSGAIERCSRPGWYGILVRQVLRLVARLATRRRRQGSSRRTVGAPAGRVGAAAASVGQARPRRPFVTSPEVTTRVGWSPPVSGGGPRSRGTSRALDALDLGPDLGVAQVLAPTGQAGGLSRR